MIGQLQLNLMGKLRKTLQNTLFAVILGDEGAEAFILQLTGLIGRGLLLEVLIPRHFWPPLMESRADFQHFRGIPVAKRCTRWSWKSIGTLQRDGVQRCEQSTKSICFTCQVWMWDFWLDLESLEPEGSLDFVAPHGLLPLGSCPLQGLWRRGSSLFTKPPNPVPF